MKQLVYLSAAPSARSIGWSADGAWISVVVAAGVHLGVVMARFKTPSS